MFNIQLFGVEFKTDIIFLLAELLSVTQRKENQNNQQNDTFLHSVACQRNLTETDNTVVQTKLQRTVEEIITYCTQE